MMGSPRTLKRVSYVEDGIYGEFYDDKDRLIFVTLEHAYPDGNGEFLPKIAPGVYTCVRYNSPEHGWCYMLQGVPDFQGKPVTYTEIHIGCYNADSKGCILLGLKLGPKMILDSRIAFGRWMDMQTGVDSFLLTVQG